MTHKESKAATGDTVAAVLDAPTGARNLHPHSTSVRDPRQDSQAARLFQTSTSAKERGDYPGFWRLRRAALLRQAELWQRGIR